VPGGYSFWDLHVAIQDAMGWFDSHLHEFRINNPEGGSVQRIGIPDDEFDDEEPTLAGWDLKISDYFSLENTSASYTYDFGDNWQHTITLKDVLERTPRLRYPRCVGGARACPPEDCGGIWGYEEFLEAIQEPAHEEHESMLEWVGGRFGAEDFDANTPGSLQIRTFENGGFGFPHPRFSSSASGAIST
ncbi:MAG: plasmid pRiA4b ORF-3 family protein, partial [Chloroflexi bacterium]|nr:plasmid pRiA4b ORF-3 family protein [Chloroflexota bacterium]